MKKKIFFIITKVKSAIYKIYLMCTIVQISIFTIFVWCRFLRQLNKLDNYDKIDMAYEINNNKKLRRLINLSFLRGKIKKN